MSQPFSQVRSDHIHIFHMGEKNTFHIIIYDLQQLNKYALGKPIRFTLLVAIVLVDRGAGDGFPTLKSQYSTF